MQARDADGQGRFAAGLTESQQACLRQVARGLTSKEIAAEIGLTPSTVDTYLKQAMSILGAANRRDASRKFLEISASQRLGSQPAPVAAPPSDRTETATPVGERTAAPNQVLELLRPPPIGGLANELGAKERIVEMLRIACLMAAVTSALVLFALGAIKALS